MCAYAITFSKETATLPSIRRCQLVKGIFRLSMLFTAENAKTDKALVRKIGKIKRGPPIHLLRNR